MHLFLVLPEDYKLHDDLRRFVFEMPQLESYDSSCCVEAPIDSKNPEAMDPPDGWSVSLLVVAFKLFFIEQELANTWQDDYHVPMASLLHADKAYWISAILTDVEFNLDEFRCSATCGGETITYDIPTDTEATTNPRSFLNRLSKLAEVASFEEQSMILDFGPDVCSDAFELDRIVDGNPKHASIIAVPSEAYERASKLRKRMKSELLTILTRFMLPVLKDACESFVLCHEPST